MLLPLHVSVVAALLAGAIDPDVEEGLQLYQRLKYDRAVVALGRALTKPDLSREDRTTALETLGFAYTVLGANVNAELTFHALLDLSPDYELDAGLSPRLSSAFAQAKGSWLEGRHVSFEVTSPESASTLTGVLRQGDPRRVRSVVTRDENGASAALSCQARSCRGERPATSFHVDVYDHTGAVLATAGPFAPRTEESDTPWWLWAMIGAGAIGGAIAISVAAAGSGDAPGGSLGRWQLP